MTTITWVGLGSPTSVPGVRAMDAGAPLLLEETAFGVCAAEVHDVMSASAIPARHRERARRTEEPPGEDGGSPADRSGRHRSARCGTPASLTRFTGVGR